MFDEKVQGAGGELRLFPLEAHRNEVGVANALDAEEFCEVFYGVPCVLELRPLVITEVIKGLFQDGAAEEEVVLRFKEFPAHDAAAPFSSERGIVHLLCIHDDGPLRLQEQRADRPINRCLHEDVEEGEEHEDEKGG